MKRCHISTLICFIMAASASAQDSTLPPTLTGFLKSGMKVGIRSYDGSPGYNIAIFTPEQFQIEVDARQIDLDQLAERYSSVSEARDKEFQRIKQSLASRQGELAPREEFTEPQLRLSIDRRLRLGTIVHLGDDYFLVSYGVDETKRQAYANRFISVVRWYSGLEFLTSVRRITNR